MREAGDPVELAPVDLWLTELAPLGPAEVAALLDVLDDGERDRAARIRHMASRRAFVAGRAVLRTLLAERTGAPARDLRFLHEPLGRPCLSPSVGAPALTFSVSHSGDLVLHAVGRRRAVGVDLELVRARPGLDDVAERAFTPGERAALRALEGAERTAAFFDIWTAKEAYLKGLGVGLSMDLDAVEILPGARHHRLPGRGADGRPDAWTVLRLPAPDGYAGALAVEGPVLPPPPPLRHFPLDIALRS